MFSRLLLFYFFTPPLPYAVYTFSLDDVMHVHDFIIILLLMTSKFTASFSILPVSDPYVQCQCLLLSLTRSTVKFKMFSEGFLFPHKHVTAYIHYLVELNHHHWFTKARMRSHPKSVLSIYSLYRINHLFFISYSSYITPTAAIFVLLTYYGLSSVFPYRRTIRTFWWSLCSEFYPSSVILSICCKRTFIVHSLDHVIDLFLCFSGASLHQMIRSKYSIKFLLPEPLFGLISHTASLRTTHVLTQLCACPRTTLFLEILPPYPGFLNSLENSFASFNPPFKNLLCKAFWHFYSQS